MYVYKRDNEIVKYRQEKMANADTEKTAKDEESKNKFISSTFDSASLSISIFYICCFSSHLSHQFHCLSSSSNAQPKDQKENSDNESQRGLLCEN